jgi:hypothetical protein
MSYNLSQPPGRRGASTRRGRAAGPDISGGKARRVYALVARGARAGVRGAALAREPLPAPSEFGQNFVVGFGKAGSSVREVHSATGKDQLIFFETEDRMSTKDWKAVSAALDENQPTTKLSNCNPNLGENPLTDRSSGIGPIYCIYYITIA